MRRTKEQAEETRRRLIAVGRRLFADPGYRAVSADTIAREASLTRGALHHHFTDKQGLFEAVYEEVLAELDDAVSTTGWQVAEETGEVWPAFVAGVRRFLDL